MASDVAVPAAAARPQIHVRGAVKSLLRARRRRHRRARPGRAAIEGLIGPNGAGKTTLMRMIMHSIPLDRGRIALRRPDGSEVDLSGLPADRMARHGVVKSNQVIMDFDKLTIWDSLLLAVTESRYEQPHRVFSEGTVFGRHEEEMRHYLDYFGFADPTTFALSAGEKKLLDIVRCLLLKPRFLLLDEPTAGLPDDLTAKVMDVVRELVDAGHVRRHRRARPQRHLEPLRLGPFHGRGQGHPARRP